MTLRQRGQRGDISKKGGDDPAATKTKAVLVPGFLHQAYEKVVMSVQNFVKSHIGTGCFFLLFVLHRRGADIFPRVGG